MFNKVGSMVTKVTIVTVTIEGIVLHLLSFERKEENLKSSSDLFCEFNFPEGPACNDTNLGFIFSMTLIQSIKQLFRKDSYARASFTFVVIENIKVS